MKKTLVTLAAGALIASVTPTLLAAEAYTDPVGGISLTIKGNGGTGTAFSYIGVPLYRDPAYRGALTARSGTTLTCSTANWTAGAYANTHYVEILSGAATGAISTITANTTTTLTTAEDLSGSISATEAFAIRKYTTLADLFGPANEAGLLGATTLAGADEVLVPNATTQGFDIYFYKTGGVGGIGWRKSTATNIDASAAPLSPNQALIVKRKASADVTRVITGNVLTRNALISIEQNVNWVNSSYPVPMTLAQMFGATGNGLTGATTLSGADEILIPNGSGGFDIYFYKTGGVGGIGWRKSTATNIDAASTVISNPGSVVVVKRKFGSAFGLAEVKPF